MLLTQTLKDRYFALAVGVVSGLLVFALFLFALSVSANAQSFIAGGFETGGNRVNLADDAKIAGQLFKAGTRIDKYAFVGGFGEVQYDLPIGHSAALSLRGLAEISTDPKNLGGFRDGTRYHLRPEVELAYPLFGEYSLVGQGGAGYTHIRNSQYNKSGLNPHAGIGLDYDKKYRFTFARVFPDRTNYNENETEGYRYRFDALVPFSDKFGARLGFEYTTYENRIPGINIRTDGNAFTFRVGVARLFNQ